MATHGNSNHRMVATPDIGTTWDMSNDYKNRIYKEQQYTVHPNLDAVHRKHIQLYILAECESEQN